jgi:hypothetical protein
LARHILSPYRLTLLEKPPVVQILKNFPTFYGTGRFVAVFRRDIHCFLF